MFKKIIDRLTPEIPKDLFPSQPKLSEEEQIFIDKCNTVANRLGFGSIQSMSAGGVMMVMLEVNGVVTPEQNDIMRKFLPR